jgi:hypothetical protein
VESNLDRPAATGLSEFVANQPAQLPNFFILGAPKCGTTSLARYLSEHPAIFLTTPKEPNYFARALFTDAARARRPAYQLQWEDYLRLYATAQPTHRRRGEASTRYLRCEAALREIRERCPAARLIAMLREPVALVQSWHAQKLWEGQETETDLEQAWRLEAARRRGEHLPPRLKARDALFYSAVASLGSQLEQLGALFPREQICCLRLDDLQRDPRGEYERVLRFLEVPSDERTSFAVHNPRRRTWASRVRGWLGREAAQPAARAITPAFEQELRDYFLPEIERLERWLGADLRSWKTTATATS